MFLFLVSCRSRTSRFLCLIFNLLFLSMSFLEMFIYSYDGVSPPILSMPSLSMILVQGSSDQIYEMASCVSRLVLFPVCLIYLLFIVTGLGLGSWSWFEGTGDLSGISIRHIHRIDLVDPGTISCIQIREEILSTCMVFVAHKQTAQLSSASIYP